MQRYTALYTIQLYIAIHYTCCTTPLLHPSVRATRARACRETACIMFHRVQCMFGEVVGHYHTPSKEHMAHTHTLLWSSFQVCGGFSAYSRNYCIFLCRCIFFFLRKQEGRRISGSSAPSGRSPFFSPTLQLRSSPSLSSKARTTSADHGTALSDLRDRPPPTGTAVPTGAAVQAPVDQVLQGMRT